MQSSLERSILNFFAAFLAYAMLSISVYRNSRPRKMDTYFKIFYLDLQVIRKCLGNYEKVNFRVTV